MTVYRRGLAFYVHLFVTEPNPAQWPVGTGLQREEWLSINTKWHHPLWHFFFLIDCLKWLTERLIGLRLSSATLFDYWDTVPAGAIIAGGLSKITGFVFSLNFGGNRFKRDTGASVWHQPVRLIMPLIITVAGSLCHLKLLSWNCLLTRRKDVRVDELQLFRFAKRVPARAKMCVHVC